METKRIGEPPMDAKEQPDATPKNLSIKIKKIERQPNGTLRVQTTPKLMVSEDTPAICVDWNTTNVLAALAILNDIPAANLPGWLSPLPKSVDVFCARVMAHVADLARPRALIGHNIFGPNTQEQTSAVCVALSHIGLTPAFQDLTALPLGTCYYLGNRRATTTATRVLICTPPVGVQFIA